MRNVIAPCHAPMRGLDRAGNDPSAVWRDKTAMMSQRDAGSMRQVPTVMDRMISPRAKEMRKGPPRVERQ